MTAEVQATIVRWREEEAAVRSRLKPSGVTTLDDVRQYTGLDFLKALLDGTLPAPLMGETLDFVPIHAEPGRAVLQCTPSTRHYNPFGSVHGGLAATMLDTALAWAVHSMLPQGRGSTTLELKVNYLRALTSDTGPVRTEGRIVNVGRQVGVAEGRIVDAAGKIYTYGSTTCLVYALQ
jgi:uncharacterized protein (TIGR00369 family)